jgi:hydrogenase maturation GTPase HydF
METTPRANRLHIGLYGKRNAGKSSLINFITHQPLTIVSEVPGTTADPVLKSMELLPLGPVVFIDTAGLDDEGALGALRVEKSKEMMNRTDLALLIISAADADSFAHESQWIGELQQKKVPVLGVLSQIDRISEPEKLRGELTENLNIPFVMVSTVAAQGRAELLMGIVQNAPHDFEKPALIGDLLPAGAPVILVAPQDIQAPKGRLILPQVQTIRDLLDHDAMALTVKDSELPALLALLKEPPALVITDSQIFPKVRDLLPKSTPLTSFSILMARAKGDLRAFVQGARVISTLKETDKILIAEACTHHALEDDIGKEKIPRWLRQKVGQSLQIDHAQGMAFPKNLAHYQLIIHCGGCMFTRKQLMSRLIEAEAANVPITNYGTAIAALNGMLERVTQIFPETKI